MSEKTQVYMLGDKQHGIVFVRMDPLLVVRVSPEEMQAYADDEGISLDQVMSMVEQKARDFSGRDDDDFVAGSDLAFAIVKEADMTKIGTGRWFYAPLAPTMAELSGPGTGLVDVALVNETPDQ